MTHGDQGSVKCASCKKVIRSPLDGDPRVEAGLPNGGVIERVIRCPHCSIELHLWARRVIAVECEQESKVR